MPVFPGGRSPNRATEFAKQPVSWDSGPITVTSDTGVIALAGFASTLGFPVTVTPGLGAITLSGFASTLGLPVTVKPNVGALTLGGFAPTISSLVAMALRKGGD